MPKESAMKKIVLIFSMIVCLEAVFAAVDQYAIRKITPVGSRQDEVLSLIDEGVRVYYYNDEYILAGIDPSQHQGFELLDPLQGTEKLYLISDYSTTGVQRLKASGRILQELGDDLLYATTLSETELKSLCQASFLAIENQALRPVNTGFKFNPKAAPKQDIANLVSQVSADSILFFIQSLQDFGTRYALADNRLDVATWIRDTFIRFGLDNAHLQEFEWSGSQYNVVAEITGSYYPEDYIVIGGHHDAITYNDPFNFAPGADDNASGTAATLEIARVLMTADFQPKCSIRFVTFAAEEFGLYGSNYNAQNSLQAEQNIRLMINHDMLANNNPGTTTVRLMPYDGCWDQTFHAAYLTNMYTDLEAIYGALNSHSSDSYAYWSRGYPVIYFFETDFSPVYHSDDDLVANLDPLYCAEVIKASLASAASFSNMPQGVQELLVQDPGAGNSLYLSWQVAADPDVDHVNVYYSPGDPTQSVPIPVFNQNYLLVTDLSEGQVYNFAVSVVDVSGDESYFSYISGATYNIPRPPEELIAQPVQNAISLSWNANTELDLAGYRLWRADDHGAPFQLLHSELLTECEFLDTDVLGAVEQLYYYRVQAVDIDGNNSENSAIAVGRPATFDNGILLIDATLGSSGANPFMPTDQQVNDYYGSLLSNFDYQFCDLQNASRDLRLYDICIYSTIIWHDVDLNAEVLPLEVRNAIQDYLALGGNLLYNGYFPTKTFAGNASYPASFPDDSFISAVLGVSSTDYNIQARMDMALSETDGLDDLPVGEHASFEAFNFHIIMVEGLFPADSGEIYYSYHSLYAVDSPYASMQGFPIGIYAQYQEGQSLLLSFPLYVIEAQSAQQMLYDLLHTKWGESTGVEENIAPALGSLSLLPNYPNPFHASTTIRLKDVDPHARLSLRVYNLKGQLIRELYQGEARSEVTWDGKDHKGDEVSSGIYFIRALQSGHSVSRKLIRIK